MAYTLDAQTTDAGIELECPGTSTVTLQISGAPVLIQFGQGTPAAVYGDAESFLPVIGSVDRDCDAIRVRPRTPGQQAHIFLTAQP